MDSYFGNLVIPITLMGCVFAASLAWAIVYFLRDKISWMAFSRTGIQIYTNDIPVWSGIVDKIERIDSNTCKNIRKQTAGLMILDPTKYKMSAEAMLVIREANQPLICAAYENHHTRELVAEGVDAELYIADKAHDIFSAVRMLTKQFPELTEERSDCYACLWVHKILITNLRKACAEKIEFYNRNIDQSGISKTIKDILIDRRDRNKGYIKNLTELAARPDIQEKSAIFYPIPWEQIF